MIQVKATTPANEDGSGSVVVWERHASHPNGEVLIAASKDKAGKAKIYEVAETALITRAILDGDLEKIEEHRPKKPSTTQTSREA